MRIFSEIRVGLCYRHLASSSGLILDEAFHPPAENLQTRNRPPLCVTERRCTYTPPVSEMLSLAPQFSDVPQSGHATANTAVPRWHREFKERSLGSPSHINQQVPRPLKPSALWPS